MPCGPETVTVIVSGLLMPEELPLLEELPPEHPKIVRINVMMIIVHDIFVLIITFSI